jgi:hypothetical protein
MRINELVKELSSHAVHTRMRYNMRERERERERERVGIVPLKL